MGRSRKRIGKREAQVQESNAVIQSEGKKVKLKPNAPVDVTVEADEKDTVPENENE